MAKKPKEVKKRKKVNGLYYPDGHFEDDDKIKSRLALENATKPLLKTKLPEAKELDYWTDRMVERRNEAKELSETVEYAEIQLPAEPTLTSFIADIHAGDEDVDYERVERELTLIKQTPDSYAIFGGDLATHFMWNPAQQDMIEQVPEQVEYVYSLFDYLNPDGQVDKMLGAFVGNHDDKWAKKTGISMYHNFSRRFGAYLFSGLSFIDLYVGEQLYKISMSHALAGYSMFNENHPQTRAYERGGAWGSDIVVSGHTHKKGIKTKTFRGYNQESYKATLINVGSYKSGDYYGEDKGFGDSVTGELYGCAVILFPDTKRILPFEDIVDAHRVFERLK